MIDGSGLRQVLSAPADEEEKVARWGRKWHTDDIHPCYLPDGKIVFSSTRCEHTILCGGSAATYFFTASKKASRWFFCASGDALG